MSSKEISIIDSHKEKIYPWINVLIGDDEPEDPNQIELSQEDSPVTKKWLGDIVIMYVADTDDSFQVILERDLQNKITYGDLHSIAVENLLRDVEYKLHNTNFGGNFLVAGGNHEAGSICLPEIWEFVSEQLDDNLIIGIPAKDLIVFVPESDEDKVSNLKIFVYEIFKDGERLLTRNIFKYDRHTKEWSIIDRVNK